MFDFRTGPAIHCAESNKRLSESGVQFFRQILLQALKSAYLPSSEFGGFRILPRAVGVEESLSLELTEMMVQMFVH